MDNDFKNIEELVSYYYFNELEDLGLIANVQYEAEKIELIDKKTFTFEKQLKTKAKQEDRLLLHPLTYTPDFTFDLISVIPGFIEPINGSINLKSLKVSDDERCYIDVKGLFAGKTNSTQYTFPIKQKVLYHLKNKYVNKFIPNKVFADTFVPTYILNNLDDKGKFSARFKGKKKSITVDSSKTIENYFKSIENECSWCNSLL